MKLYCMVCYKSAQIMAYGNSYCKKHFELSDYYTEQKIKEKIKNEKKERK